MERLVILLVTLLVTLVEHRHLSDVSTSNSVKMNTGHESTIEQYPFVALIKHTDGSTCGGTILSGTELLTTATCFTGHESNFSLAQVLLGSTYEDSRASLDHHVSSVVYAPGFNNPTNLTENVAIFLIEPQIEQFSNSVLPIGISEDPLTVGTQGMLTGYHLINDGVKTPQPRRLQSVNVTVMSNESCLEAYPATSNATTKNFVINQLLCVEPEDKSMVLDVGSTLVVDGRARAISVYPEGYNQAKSLLLVFDLAKVYNFIAKYVSSPLNDSSYISNWSTTTTTTSGTKTSTTAEQPNMITVNSTSDASIISILSSNATNASTSPSTTLPASTTQSTTMLTETTTLTTTEQPTSVINEVPIVFPEPSRANTITTVLMGVTLLAVAIPIFYANNP